MQVGVIGINFKITPLHFRESFIEIVHCLKKDCPDFVLLSTCNRVEFYFSCKNLDKIYARFSLVLQGICFFPGLYSHFSESCFLHLAKVTAGLDSPLFLESDIQRQVKLAYAEAKQQRCLSSVLHYIFQKALHVAKTLRSDNKVQKCSLASVIWELARKTFPDIPKKKVLFVGFSRTNQQIFYYWRSKVVEIGFSSRRKEAEKFCAKNSISWVPWKSRDYASFDILIIATKSTPFALQKWEKKEKTLLFDISVPRFVDPKINNNYLELLDMKDVNAALLAKQKNDEARKNSCIACVKTHVARLCVKYTHYQKQTCHKNCFSRSGSTSQIA